MPPRRVELLQGLIGRTGLGRLAAQSVVGLGLGFSVCAVAQPDAGAARRLTIQPSLTLSQTLSNNYDLDPSVSESDGITRLTAGIAVRSTGGAITGSIDYSLGFLSYARHSAQNGLQNALQADVNAELIEDRLQVSSSASISRSAVSAFGVQPGLTGDASGNTVELRALRIAPTLRGPIGTSLRYSLGLGLSLSDASGGSTGDVSGRTVQFRLEPQRGGVLGWSLDASHQMSDFKLGRSSTSSQLSARLGYVLKQLDLELSATGGAERTDLESASGRSTSNWGIGAIWTPSPITRVSADVAHRFFGRSHTIAIDHRTPRTLWQLRSSRSLSSGGAVAVGAQRSAYDLLFAQLSSVQPDPVLREALVLQTLRDRGIDANQGVDLGFLQSAATVQESLEASAAWTSPRSTATVSVRQGKSRRVDALANVTDDLSGGNVVRTRALSINLSHRLTPMSSANLLVSQQRSEGSVTGQSNRQDQMALQYSTRLTIDSTLGATLRHVRIHNETQSYGESALTATYGLRF